MGSSESKAVHGKLHQASAAGVHFPHTFTLFYNSSWSKLRLLIGQDLAHPLYTCSLPSGWWGDLLIYNGATVDCAPLAAVRKSGWQHSVITLPPLGPGQEPIEETMTTTQNRLLEKYSFAVAVDGGSDAALGISSCSEAAGEPGPGTAGNAGLQRQQQQRRVERFEWVSSKGDEVRSLGEWNRGWKLVRPDNHGEVLAVWADSSMSFKKAAKFSFVNDNDDHDDDSNGDGGIEGGAKTREQQLGQTWMLMATVSFVRIWQLQMQKAMNAGISANAAAA